MDLWVATHPEVDFGRCPNSMSILEEKLGSGGSERLRLDGERVRSYKIKGKALQGWVRDKVPKAMAGVEVKVV